MQGQFGDDELVEADAFGFGLAGQRGVQRFGNADVELAAEFAPLGADGRVRQAVDEPDELAAAVAVGGLLAYIATCDAQRGRVI